MSTDGIDHLLEQRDELADLVDQLGGSELEDAASLRLLTEALRERLGKLEEKLDESRRCEVRIALVGGTAGVGAGATAAVVGAIASAVSGAIRDALPDLGPRAIDEASLLSLTDVDITAGGGCIVLTSPARPRDQLLVDPATDRPVLFVALDALCDALEGDASDTLTAVAEALAEEPVALRVSVTSPEGERTLELTRAALQRAASA